MSRTYVNQDDDSTGPTGGMLPRWAWAVDLRNRVDFACCFLVVGATFGMFMAFAMPPGQGMDETTHFYRAWTISEGSWLARMDDGRAGGPISNCYVAYFHDVSTALQKPAPLQFGTFWHLPAGCSQSANFVAFDNTAVYAPVDYVPQFVALRILRLLPLPFPVLFYAGRLAGLLAYLAVFFVALRITPVGRAALFVVGVMPMSIQLAATYSATSITLALAALATALTLRSRFDPTATWRTIAALSLTLVLLGLSKFAYVAVAAVIFLVPGSFFPSRRWAAFVKAGVVVVAVLADAAWASAVHNVSLAASAPPGAVFSVSQQLHQLYLHPWRYPQVLLRGILNGNLQKFWVRGFVWQVEAIRAGAGTDPFASPLVTVAGWALLAQAYGSDAGHRVRLAWDNAMGVLVPIGVAVAGTVAIITVLYLAAMPVGSKDVALTGDYFLPLAAVLAISAACMAERSSLAADTWRRRGSPMLFAACSVFLLGYAAYRLLDTFFLTGGALR